MGTRKNEQSLIRRKITFLRSFMVPIIKEVFLNKILPTTRCLNVINDHLLAYKAKNVFMNYLPHSRAISPGQLIEASFCQSQNMPAESPIFMKIKSS